MKRGAWIVVGLAVLLVSAPVAAQSEAERTALARELFAQGTAHLEADRFDEAADALGRAYELRPASGIAFNLAAAYEQLGRLVEALELTRSVLGDASAPNRIKRLARQAQDRIVPRIARLTIRVPDGAEGATITLDGREVLHAALDVAAPTDPGEHTLILSRDGATISAEQITLEEGDSEVVTLYSQSLTPVGGPEGAVDESESDGGILGEWWFWTIVGAVVVAGVVIGVAAAAASGPEDPIQGTAGVVVWP